ncbi:MAG TPA: PAS domain-containing protein, partial [Nakamurella sp.]|nr:PAS domain-containing protein [Nakamurella sp.]
PAPSAVALTIGPQHHLVYTNPAYRAAAGDDLLGRPIGESLGEPVPHSHRTLFDHVLATGDPVSLVETWPGQGDAPPGHVSDPDDRIFSFSLSRFTHERPGVLLIAVDITEQVTATRRADRASEEQRRWRRRFESLVWVSAQIVWVADPAGRVIDSSGGWEQVTGQRPQESRGYGWAQTLHSADRQPTLQSWRKARRQHHPWHHTYRVRTRDGQYRHFDVQAAPVYEGGALVEWVGTCTDVEQRWQERQHRELLDRAAAAAAERTELHEMFAALTKVLVPTLADGCGVHLLRPGRSACRRPDYRPPHRYRVAGRDPPAATDRRGALFPRQPVRSCDQAAPPGVSHFPTGTAADRAAAQEHRRLAGRGEGDQRRADASRRRRNRGRRGHRRPAWRP